MRKKIIVVSIIIILFCNIFTHLTIAENNQINQDGVIYDVDLSCEDNESDVYLEPLLQGSIIYHLVLTNTGKSPDSYEFEIQQNVSWVTTALTPLDDKDGIIMPGQSEDLYLMIVFRSPFIKDGNIANVTVIVKSLNSNAEDNATTLTTFYKPIFIIEEFSISYSRQGYEEAIYDIKLTVRNVGHMDAENVSVQFSISNTVEAFVIFAVNDEDKYAGNGIETLKINETKTVYYKYHARTEGKQEVKVIISRIVPGRYGDTAWNNATASQNITVKIDKIITINDIIWFVMGNIVYFIIGLIALIILLIGIRRYSKIKERKKKVKY